MPNAFRCFFLVLLLHACGTSESKPALLSDAGASTATDVSAETSTDLGTSSEDASTPDAPHDASILELGDAGGDATAPDAGEPSEPEPPKNPGSTVKTFRVLHWNIAGGKENDCRTAGITAAVVKYVKDKNVDFVGLNEVCPAQHDSIRDALRREWGKGANAKISAFVGDGTGRVVGNAIFSRLNLRDVTRLRVGADQYGDRNLICGLVGNYDHLRFCGTHLTPGDAGARIQLGRVFARLEKWWSDRRDTVIITGDFNLRPNDRSLNGVYSSGANHPQNNPGNNGRYREVDDNDRQNCPGYGERSVLNTTGGPCNAGGKIDFIFARENRIVGGDYNGDTLNIPSTCGGRCSDHRAVFGRIKLEIRAND